MALAGAWALAIALLLALVAPAAAGAGPTRLSGGSVSPGSGTTKTTISFEVSYRNREGSPAGWVRVNVAGDNHAMSTTGTDWKNGVTFTWSGQAAGRVPTPSRSRPSAATASARRSVPAP